MYTRGICTKIKPQECNITVLLAAVIFFSEKLKVALIRSFTYGISHQYEGQMPHEIRRASPTKLQHKLQDEGSIHSGMYKIIVCRPLNHSGSLHCAATQIRLLTTRRCSVTSNGRYACDLQVQSRAMSCLLQRLSRV